MVSGPRAVCHRSVLLEYSVCAQFGCDRDCEVVISSCAIVPARPIAKYGPQATREDQKSHRTLFIWPGALWTCGVEVILAGVTQTKRLVEKFLTTWLASYLKRI